MKTQPIVWLDTMFLPISQATIPITTHALHYGTSVFEGIRFYLTADGRIAIFRLDDHIRRLRYSASLLQLRFTFTDNEIITAIKRLIAMNGHKEGYIRPLIYFGNESLGLDTRKLSSHVALIVQPWGKYLEKDAVRLLVSPLRRIPPTVADLRAKIGGLYALNVVAHQYAVDNGYDEALFLDEKDEVAEGAGENIFFGDGEYLCTPGDGYVLPGITRNSVMEIARILGIPVRTERSVVQSEKVTSILGHQYTEAFFTGTAAEISPVSAIYLQIDDQYPATFSPVPGKLTRKIKDEFERVIRGTHPLSSKWLTYCDENL